ncbi:MAG TPA: protease inhibitor I42 family protein [Chitinophagales bacterium]|nr:protease inhibitor I42 family protein [Chitinophagales bacterium]HRK29254.1 protease inhibitor I42 family protein [Chitinophagales bacterium]
MKTYYWFIILTALLLGLAACKTRKKAQQETNLPPTETSGKVAAQAPNLFTLAQNGQLASVKLGDTLWVHLEANITTGYAWAIANIDTSLLQLVSDEYVPTPTGEQQMVGSGGMQQYTFLAQATGSAMLQMVYKRPWEPATTQPVRSFEIKVEVLSLK